jgi:hypothetical protein
MAVGMIAVTATMIKHRRAISADNLSNHSNARDSNTGNITQMLFLLNK